MENYHEIIIGIHDDSDGDYDKLSKLIDDRIKPRSGDKFKLAEIPTKYNLRRKMIDALNLVVSYWNRPHKVFEPCCGKGGFLIDVYANLINGLKDIMPDSVERKKFVLEECLYFGDINPENVEICKLLLDPNNEYRLNSYVGDTLSINLKSIWNIDGFDLVFGNPPFNGQTGTGTGTPIWNKFVKKALDYWVNDNGYLLFVHPSGWRKPCYSKSHLNGMFDLMTKRNHLKFLSIHSVKEGMKEFGCSTRFDYYLIQRIKLDKETIVNDEDSVQKSYNMKELSWFPNKNIDWILTLISLDGNKCKVFCDSKYHAVNKENISDVRNEVFKYPLIHSTPKSGVRYKYSRYNDKGHYGISKIIFGESGINDVVIDMDGEYGLTQGAIGIIVNDIEQANNMKTALMSTKFKKLLEGTMFGNYRIDWRLFTHINDDFPKYFD